MFDESEFIKVYKEAFGGPPYFEQYSDEEVREEIVLPHLRDGVVAYATDNDTLVGFGCALPFDRSPEDVQEFLSDLDSIGEILSITGMLGTCRSWEFVSPTVAGESPGLWFDRA